MAFYAGLAPIKSHQRDFDDIIIYENLQYPPITQVAPITLYYMIEDVEGIFTQLTLVGMLDYQRSINSTQHPDLTLRMLLDLSKMVKTISDEIINFDPIFAKKNAQEVLARYEERKEQHSLDFFVDRKENQIEDFGETRMKHNPFTENDPASFETEDEVVSQIAMRFDDYMENQSQAEVQQSSPFVNKEKFSERAAFLDSISSLYTKISRLQEELVSQQSQLLQTATKLEEQMAEPEIIYDTVIVEVESSSQKDSINLLKRDLILRRNTIAYLQSEIEQMQLVRKPEIKYIRDTVTVFDRQESLVLQIENQSLMDSLILLREKLEMREAELASTQKQLSASQALANTPKIIRDTLEVEVPVEVDNSEEELAFLAAKHAWKDSLQKTNLQLLAMENENEELRQKLETAKNTPPPTPIIIKDTVLLTSEPMVIRDTIYQQVLIEDQEAKKVLLAEKQTLQDSLRDQSKHLLTQNEKIADLQNTISQLRQQPAPTPQIIRDTFFVQTPPAILRDTIFIEAEPQQADPKDISEISQLRQTLTKVREQLLNKDMEIIQLQEQLQLTQNNLTPSPVEESPVVVHDTIFVEREADAQALVASSSTQRELSKSLTEARKQVLEKDLEIDQLKQQLSLMEAPSSAQPKIIRDTITIMKENTEAQMALQERTEELKDSLRMATKLSEETELFKDSVAYLNRINARMEHFLQERQTRIEVLQSQLAWIEDQPKIGYDTVYVEVPAKVDEARLEAQIASSKQPLVDSLSNLRFLVSQKEGDIDQLKQQIKSILDQPATPDTIIITDQQQLLQLQAEKKQLEDSLMNASRKNQLVSRQMATLQEKLATSNSENTSLNTQLRKALAEAGDTQKEAIWQDSVTNMQQKIGMMKQIMADRKDRIQQLKEEMKELEKNPTIIRDTVEVEVMVQAPQENLNSQLDSLSRVARHWRIKANSTDSLLADQTQHIGRLINVINNSRQEEDSLSQLISLQQDQIEQSLVNEIMFQRTKDSLAAVSNQWEWRYEALRDSQRVDGSPELSSAAKEFKQEFFEDRITQLTAAQQTLVQKEWRVESQIKRIQQREKFLADWETDPDQSKLLGRINELEAQLNQAEEARLAAQDIPQFPQNGLEIQSVYLFKSQKYFPAYSVRTSLSENQLNSRVRQWFHARSYKPAKGGKLFYEQVILPELSAEPIDIAFEIIDSESGKGNQVLVSARRKDGSFLSGGRGDLDGLRIRRLLYELFWFSK